MLSIKEKEIENEQIEPKEKKKATKPSWRPGGKMPELKARPGFTAKWAARGNLNKLLAEGWQIMKESDHVGNRILLDKTDINDNHALGSEIVYREMIAVMLPNDLKDARDEWLKNENKSMIQGIFKETDQEMKNMGVQTFKPKEQAGRIVID